MPMIAFVLAAADDGPMIVNRLDGHTNDHGAFGVGIELLSTGAHDRQDIDGLRGILTLRQQHHGDGVVALDLGANIGTHTVAWARTMRDWGRVLAVEAQERVFYALAGNIALNNLFNAKAMCAVVSARDGWLNVPVLDHQRPASFGSLELIRATDEDIGQIPQVHTVVRMLTIDFISEGDRVDLIKLDIEGMEVTALEGAESTIERCRPVIFAEWLKCGQERLRTWLEERGYVTHVLGMNILAVHESDPIGGHITPRQEKTPEA